MAGEPIPCTSCGWSSPVAVVLGADFATDRENESIVVTDDEFATSHEMARLKTRQPGMRPEVELVAGEELHQNSGEWRHVYRRIDRVADWYDEIIRRPDVTVEREVHEPLSQHRGRGSARTAP